MDVMNLDPWLKFGHVLGAVVWVGGVLMLSLVAAQARRSSDPNAAIQVSRTVAYVGPRAIFPGFLAVLVFGLWMVLADAAWDFSQTWVLLALGLFGLAFLTSMFYGGRISIQLRRAAETGDPVTTNTTALLGRFILSQWIVLLILVVAVWDMIFKPGL
jgi:uncharacterized membrane protein